MPAAAVLRFGNADPVHGSYRIYVDLAPLLA